MTASVAAVGPVATGDALSWPKCAARFMTTDALSPNPGRHRSPRMRNTPKQHAGNGKQPARAHDDECAELQEAEPSGAADVHANDGYTVCRARRKQRHREDEAREDEAPSARVVPSGGTTASDNGPHLKSPCAPPPATTDASGGEYGVAVTFGPFSLARATTPPPTPSTLPLSPPSTPPPSSTPQNPSPGLRPVLVARTPPSSPPPLPPLPAPFWDLRRIAKEVHLWADGPVTLLPPRCVAPARLRARQCVAVLVARRSCCGVPELPPAVQVHVTLAGMVERHRGGAMERASCFLVLIDDASEPSDSRAAHPCTLLPASPQHCAPTSQLLLTVMRALCAAVCALALANGLMRALERHVELLHQPACQHAPLGAAVRRAVDGA